ncbi:rhodanese-like domain-containing protein [Roseospirillum parvum]|uniref:Rhodanese-related sulfurtransferase n=1 Tax=Roseospirillum parvum TaxID=83401 RepID=A0A1G8A1P5_9PROT|nr:rhodanese-like domain-containing protein [Roseospirillum parvum]SDH14783.1 Rhodanese-related sulfurtransferase [Roseospirillum parvum]
MFAAAANPTSALGDQVRMVPADQVKAWMDADQAVVFDVREANEYMEAHIPGTILLPLSRFEPERVRRTLAATPDKRLVLHCRSGIRCGMAAGKLRQAGLQGEINRMEGGIGAWYKAGLPLASGLPGVS